jgi:hypothetical protein
MRYSGSFAILEKNSHPIDGYSNDLTSVLVVQDKEVIGSSALCVSVLSLSLDSGPRAQAEAAYRLNHLKMVGRIHNCVIPSLLSAISIVARHTRTIASFW